MVPLLAILVACTPPPEPCQSGTAHVYDPGGSELTAWPDDHFTVADPGSPTGRRVEASTHPWTASLDGVLVDIAAQLDGLTGFATAGEIVLRFDGPVDPDPTGLQLLDLSRDPPEPVALEARVLDAGRQLMLRPLRPLRQGTEHALLLPTTWTASSGECITPAAATTRALQDGVHDALLESLDLHPAEVSALLRFTTHDDQQPVVEAAEQARQAPQAWTEPLACEAVDGFSICDTAFEPLDFRDARGDVVPSGGTRQRVPVRWWLPDGVDRPVVVVLGHGLGGSFARSGDITRQAERLTGLGVAAVAIDALQHGTHPTATTEGGATALPFLGIDLTTFTFDARLMRANFDQSILERVQLVELVKSSPDLDGDGLADVDADRIGAVGISLGGLMNNGLLALSPDVEMGVLTIAGGNLSILTRDTEVMEAVLPLLANLAGSDHFLETLLQVTQTVVDPSDPASWATRVLEDRLEGTAPHVLLPVAMYDEVVPPLSGRALAQAYALPHVEPVVEPVPGLPPAGEAPIAANHPSGATAGFFQYETVTVDGRSEPAVHGNLPSSEECITQVSHFVRTWIDGTPEIIAP